MFHLSLVAKYRGDAWRRFASSMHGGVIEEKERFMAGMRELEKEVATIVADKVTSDRVRTKGQSLSQSFIACMCQ